MLKVLVVSLGGEQPADDKLRHELSLVRSSALYADEVTLMSVGAELLLGYQDMLSTADPAAVWELLGRTPGLREKVGQLPDVESALMAIAERIRQSDGIWRDEYRELDLGRKSGLIKIEAFTRGPWGEEEDGNDSDRFLRRLGDLVNRPDVHPLLDNKAAEYARALQVLDAGAIDARAHRRARTAEIGAGMIARLPAFPSAPLDELLDAKRELHRPLDRYRAIVADLQQVLDAELGSEEMGGELDDLWMTKVRPALVELEETLLDSSFTRELARHAATSVRALITQGAALYITLSRLSDMASSISAAVAAAGIATETAASAALSTSASRRAARRDDFYYLYELQRRAGSRHS